MLSTIALPNDTRRELADALLADLAAGKAAVYLDQPWGRMPALSEREVPGAQDPRNKYDHRSPGKR